MRFIKRTTLIMALALIVPILAACGGSTPTTAPSQPTQASAAQPSVVPTEAVANAQPTTTVPTAAAPTEAAATDTPAPSGADKTVIVAMTQFPDTLFAIESQSLATAHVIQAVQPTCINNLAYDYQAVCFEKVPDFADGDAVINKVTVDSSYAGSIVINNELITDTSALTGPIELDQVQVTWKLVDGLTWEDGTPLTAEDFVFAAELYRSPDIRLTTRFVLDRTEKYEAPDAQTLVWYGAPGYEDATYFLNTFGPEPKHLLESMAPGDIGAGEYANHPLAYGPYKIVENIPQESTTLVANPTYWRAAEGLPKIGNVVFKYLTSEDQILQQMESGEVDVSLSSIGLTVAQAPQLDLMESAGTVKAQYVAGTSWDHLDFGMIRSDGPDPFFNDLKVRQAIAYAINRQEIVDEVMFGKAPIMNSILPEEHWAYPPAGQGLETYVYDPAKAAQLLDEAGWTLGSDGIREKDGRKMSAIQFYTTENNQSRQSVAQVIQENLKQVGIDIELNFVPGTAVLFANGEEGILSNHTFDLALYGFTSSSDPNMSLYLCNQIPSAANNYDGQNNPGYCSEEFDSVALAANAETDREARIPLAVQAQQIINRDLPTLPLYQKVKVGAARPGVSGFQLDPTNQQDTYNIDEWDITE